MDGLHAGLSGTGSPIPDVHRAGPWVAIVALGHFFIIDTGEGSAKNVLLINFPQSRYVNWRSSCPPIVIYFFFLDI